MKYVTYDMFAENNHSHGKKISRPIMFEVHDINSDSVTFRIRDIKLRHCTCSLKVNTKLNLLDINNELNPMMCAIFLSNFLKHYYMYAVNVKSQDKRRCNGEFGYYEVSSSFEDEDDESMGALMSAFYDYSMSISVIKGIIDSLDEFITAGGNCNTETGEKTKSVQNGRFVLEFNYEYDNNLSTVKA